LCVLGVRSVKSQQGHSFLNTNVERLVSRFPIVWSQSEQTEVTQLTDIADVKPEIKASEIIQSVSVIPVVPVIIKQEPLPVVSAVKPNEQISRALVQVDDKPIKNRLVAVSSVNHFVPKKKIEYKQRLIQAEPPRISQKVMPEIHPHSQENSVSVANIKNNQPLTHTKKIVAQPILAHVELPKPMPLQHTQELPKHIAKVGSIDRQSVWRDKAPVMAQMKPSSAWVDEQEAAARDRAASRLRLSRLGVEFNEDSLINAAQKGDLKVVKLLIDGGIPRNIKNHSGQTALMASAKNGHKHIIKELLKPKRSL
jgi:Ankyrin repeats (3 copies)